MKIVVKNMKIVVKNRQKNIIESSESSRDKIYLAKFSDNVFILQKKEYYSSVYNWICLSFRFSLCNYAIGLNSFDTPQGSINEIIEKRGAKVYEFEDIKDAMEWFISDKSPLEKAIFR